MSEIRDEIARLEIEIERLSETAERCRKIAWVSKAAISAGGAWVMAILLGFTPLNGMALVGVIVLVIGGVVSLGSNQTTANQTAESIEKAERERAVLIGEIDLRLVSDRGQQLIH
jgi:hypothetical protein